MNVRASSVVPLPLEQAFLIVADMEHWFPMVDDGIVRCTKMTRGATSLGTRFEEVVKGPTGNEMLFNIEVTSFDAPNSVGFTSSGPILVAEGSISCAAAEGGGTEVTMDFDASPRGVVGWLIWPVLYFSLKGVEQGRLSKLAQLVTSGEIAPHP